MVDRLGEPLAEPIFEELAIIGVGLIGSSIARAARRRRAARRIVLADRSVETLDRAKALGLGDLITDDLARAVSHADCVILCAPLGANEAIGRAIGRALRPGTIVSDVGSVKGAVIAALKSMLPAHARLVPAHPVAGTEYSGPDAGFASLFINRWCILTPPEGTDERAVEKVRAFWQALGSHVEIMGAAHHDLVLAITSHVPHLIAYNLVGAAADLEEVTRSEVIKFSAGGFRDFHPDRGVRPNHVARRLFVQQGRGARDARPVQRGFDGAAKDDPARGRRRAVRPVHPDPGDPARHRGARPGYRGARFRPQGHGNG